MAFEPIRGYLCLTQSERVIWRQKLAAMSPAERRDWRDWVQREKRERRPEREAMKKMMEGVGRRFEEICLSAVCGR